jgi:hypothetical protein
MKYHKAVLTLIIFVGSFQLLYSQTAVKPAPESVYVIVHGAWGGGWAFKKVDSLLTQSGSKVYRPTLTGQGERVHLATKDIGLSTHINDIVNTILYEDLKNVILIGHSYSGIVVTGVADSIPERIAKLIYIDAFVPEDNESIMSIYNKEVKGIEIVNGYMVPKWVSKSNLPPSDVPHPLKTWTDKISLKNPKRTKLPTTFILTVDKGADPKLDDFASQANRAEKKGWPILQLEADHNPQWSAPEELVKMLKKLEKE